MFTYSIEHLTNCQPVFFQPKLAKLIGINEAIVLQQINYFQSTSKNLKLGEKWIYNSYSAWCDVFPFWSLSTVKRAINSLQDKNLLVTSNFNKFKIDKTKWYRVNFIELDNLLKNSNVDIGLASDKVLTNDQTMAINPHLAQLIGFKEAIVLQQINYFLSISQNIREGNKWIYNTFEQWAEIFPFWSKPTIHRIFNSLEQQGLLIISSFNKFKLDRTQWYRIDYEALNRLIALTELQPKARKVNKNLELFDSVKMITSNSSNRSHRSDQNDPIRCDQFEPTNNHKDHKEIYIDIPPTPQRAGKSAVDEFVKTEFEKVWTTYTKSPNGEVVRNSGKTEALRLFKRQGLANRSAELCKIIEQFWQEDVDWRKGFQPKLVRFLRERRYEDAPQKLNEKIILTPAEIAEKTDQKEQERKFKLNSIFNFEAKHGKVTVENLEAKYVEFVKSNRPLELINLRNYVNDLYEFDNSKYEPLKTNLMQLMNIHN